MYLLHKHTLLIFLCHVPFTQTHMQPKEKRRTHTGQSFQLCTCHTHTQTHTNTYTQRHTHVCDLTKSKEQRYKSTLMDSYRTYKHTYTSMHGYIIYVCMCMCVFVCLFFKYVLHITYVVPLLFYLSNSCIFVFSF